MKFNIRLLYLYLFSFVGLVIVVIGTVNLVNLGLKTFIFTEADRYEVYAPAPVKEGEYPQLSENEQRVRQDRELKRQRERQLTDAVSMIVVGIPLYLYHWRIIKKENKPEQGSA